MTFTRKPIAAAEKDDPWESVVALARGTAGAKQDKPTVPKVDSWDESGSDGTGKQGTANPSPTVGVAHGFRIRPKLTLCSFFRVLSRQFPAGILQPEDSSRCRTRRLLG